MLFVTVEFSVLLIYTTSSELLSYGLKLKKKKKKKKKWALIVIKS